MDDMRSLIDAGGTLVHVSRASAQHQTRESEINIRDLQQKPEDLGPSQDLIELVIASSFQDLALGILSLFTETS